MIKRIFDTTVAIAGLLVVSPLLLLLAVLIRAKLGSPIMFSQVRPGKDAKPFRMYKFRSMTSARDSNGALLPDSERLTPFGRFLRSSSLDELPELWNVVRGDMSLVGPRPLAEAYLPLYSKEQFRRHEVLPGITGWAQINGRNSISWKQKFAYDVWYLDNQTLLLDLRILVLTAKKVLFRSDVKADGQHEVASFDGTN